MISGDPYIDQLKSGLQGMIKSDNLLRPWSIYQVYYKIENWTEILGDLEEDIYKMI